MLIKILLVIAILIQTVATAYALKLVRATKYNSVWILFIVGFSLLSVERFVQLLMASGHRWQVYPLLCAYSLPIYKFIFELSLYFGRQA